MSACVHPFTILVYASSQHAFTLHDWQLSPIPNRPPSEARTCSACASSGQEVPGNWCLLILNTWSLINNWLRATAPLSLIRTCLGLTYDVPSTCLWNWANVTSLLNFAWYVILPVFSSFSPLRNTSHRLFHINLLSELTSEELNLRHPLDFRVSTCDLYTSPGIWPFFVTANGDTFKHLLWTKLPPVEQLFALIDFILNLKQCRVTSFCLCPESSNICSSLKLNKIFMLIIILAWNLIHRGIYWSSVFLKSGLHILTWAFITALM